MDVKIDSPATLNKLRAQARQKMGLRTDTPKTRVP
jgi:hypothetical protein